MTSKLAVVACVLICGLVTHAPHARAQSFRLNSFRSAERADDGFAVRRMGAFEHLRWGALVTADYAHDPLVIEQKRGARSELSRIVQHQLTLKLDLSLALWNRLFVFAGGEVQPLVAGPRPPAGFELSRADGAGMGDLAFGARVRLLGERDDLFALGAQATLIAPTAGSQRYRGEEGIAVRPELIAELRPKPVRISFNLGALLREQQRLLDARVASQLHYALAAAIPLLRNLEALAELWGDFGFQDFGAKTSTPVEWLLGGKYRSEGGLYAGLSAGRGLTRGIGAPDARAVVQLGYLAPERRKPPVAPAPPPPQEPVVRDRDGDGISDASDACPDQPEDLDDFEDADGCLDADNDKDGVLDVEDTCPELTGTVAERGCPGKVQITEEGELVVFHQIHFQLNQSVILAESLPNMEAVQKVLEEHPQMTKVRIEGHTDSKGQDSTNLTLSRQRAAAVAGWLVEHGIASGRLEAFGCGELYPVADDSTPEGQAKNRRVMFQVVEPLPADGARALPPAGCVPAL